MAKLILTYKNKVISNHEIEMDEALHLGRDAANQVVINHPSVSGRHAKIHKNSTGLFLSDLGSTNGTFVNEDKVADCQLAHQDWIRIGKHVVIVDLYDTLSLEATVQMLMSGVPGSADAEGTMMLDIDMLQSKSSYATLDYLSFLNNDRADLELSYKPVTIGKNRDADIVIKGFWSFFAGQPSATIIKQDGEYFLEHVTGLLKPKLNGMAVQDPIRLRHHDVITVGPIKMELYLAQ